MLALLLSAALAAAPVPVRSLQAAWNEAGGATGRGGGAAARTVTLRNADFRHGTYRVTQPGTYYLGEDIVFDPVITPENMSWSQFPADSEQYPQNGGYFLGFFAALTVEAEDVTLDCQQHSMAMGVKFHRTQRFFSIIELASSPFVLAQGPPPFANPDKTNATLVSANNTVIRNCVFGLSSHHSIHGNGNTGVTIHDSSFKDFEVGCVSLNGASSVTLYSLDCGPSLAQTFTAKLSQAVFMDHIVQVLMPENGAMESFANSTNITLKGQVHTVRELFDALHDQLQEFIHNLTGPLVEEFGNGTAPPDGSAIYGFLLHRRGVAIGRFGVPLCPDDTGDIDDKLESQRVTDIEIRDVVVHDLRLKVNQVAAIIIDGRKVKGLGGDVFEFTQVWNTSGCFSYVRNALTDAQLAAGRLREVTDNGVLPDAVVKCFLGSTFIPAILLEWAAEELDCTETGDFVYSIWKGDRRRQWECNGDAMAHHNKGVVAVRLEFLKNVNVFNTTVANLTNEGALDAETYCYDESYQGRDVRTISTAYIKNMTICEVYTDGSFVSTSGGDGHVYPVLASMRGDDHSEVAAPADGMPRRRVQCAVPPEKEF